MKAVCNTSKWRRRVYTRIIIFLFFFFIHHISFSQCPANIDFESGTFDGWNCWVGSVSDFNGVNNISLHLTQGPVAGQHTMLSSVPGDGLDEYGGFPKNCPNGSGHSVKLGNDQAGGFAEGLSYQFTVPLTSNKFTLTYSYAVVFEDPGHNPEKQPRLEVEVWDVTAEEMIDCFSFEYIAVGGLPGFQVQGWFGLLAPSSMPAEAVARLNAECVKALAGPMRVVVTASGAIRRIILRGPSFSRPKPDSVKLDGPVTVNSMVLASAVLLRIFTE